ncbi:MAG TPA: type I-D CRISPR-associated endonuclease Cas1d [Roseiflexaceae bacterium]|nr:type I-D CRISPR-associated endonuclease Cas1d [Roseiflexaceae bacterium]
MGTLYLSEQYSVVKCEGEALRVQIPARDGAAARVARVPLNKVDQVVVWGDITLTAPALHMLLEQRIAIHFLSHWGKSYGSLIPDPTKNALLHLSHYAAHSDLSRRFPIARAMISGKLTNMRTALLRYNRKLEAPAIETAAAELRHVLRQLAALPTPAAAAPGDRMHGLGALFGLEGSGSSAYFGVFGTLLRDPWSFPGRVRRPPTDPVNALLSFGYTVLTNQIVSLICTVGLNPYIGMLHQPGYGKPALALDLVEEFRPLVVDSVVISMLNNRMLKENDFTAEMGAYRLRDDARRLFLQQIEDRLNEQIQHPLFGYRTTYRRCIELQVRVLAKALMGEIPQYVPFIVR